MRDIYQKLRVIGLTHDACSEVIDLIVSLTIDELNANGNNNVCHPAGYKGEDYDGEQAFFSPSTSRQAKFQIKAV